MEGGEEKPTSFRPEAAALDQVLSRVGPDVDIDVLIDYPIDYMFPAFGRDKQGSQIYSGFFPADPKALHADPETLLPNKLQASALSNLVNASKRDSR